MFLELLSQFNGTDLSSLAREAGVVGVLAWAVFYFQKKWDRLDARHEELHAKTLSVVSTNTAAIAEMTREMHNMKKDIRLCQIVRSGDFEAMKKALDESS